MLNKFTKIFGTQGVYTSTNYFYQLLVLNFWFSLMTLPWIMVNVVFKLTPLTAIFYLLAAVWLLPNIQAAFQLFSQITDESKSLKISSYWQALRTGFSKKLYYSLLAVGVLGILLGEIYLILKVPVLNFLSPLFFVVIVFLSVSVMMAFYLNREGILAMKPMIKTSLIMAWRNPVRTLVYFLLIALWMSIGYWIPLVNVLGGSVCFFYLLHVLFKRYLNKLYKKYS